MRTHNDLAAFTLLLLISLAVSAQEQSAQPAAFNTAYKQYQSLADAGKWNESLPYAKQALDIGEVLFGEQHKNTAALTYNYALNLGDVDRVDEAYEQILRTIERYQAVHGKASEELVTVYMDAGRIAAKGGRARDAMGQYDRGLAIVAANYGEESEAYARLSLDAGSKLLDLAFALESRYYLHKSHDVYVDLAGQDNLGTAVSAFYLGKCYLSVGQNDKAETYLTEALGGIEQDSQNSQRLALLARAYLVEAYQEQGKPHAATEHLLAIGRAVPQDPDQALQPLFRRAPAYPKKAVQEKKEGFVVVEFDIDAEGFVKNVETVDVQGHPDFEQAAVEAAKEFRYVPSFVNGEPVLTEDVRTRLTFKLSD